MPMTHAATERNPLASTINELNSECDFLSRNNEYLRERLSESSLLKTVHRMKRERDLLWKLLTNLTEENNDDEQLKYLQHHIKE